MKLLGSDDLCRKIERGKNIICADFILAGDFLDGHSACKPADNTSDRHARPSNHRLAVLDFRIDNDSIIHGKILLFAKGVALQSL